MDSQDNTSRRKRRLVIIGIGLIIWGAFAESFFLVIVGGGLIAIALASDRSLQRQSDQPGYQPPLLTPEVEPLQPPSSRAAPRELEQGDFSVILLSPGSAALMVEVTLAALLGITEEQAHEIVATRASLLASGVSGVEADRIKSALEPLGAQVDIVQVRNQPQEQPPATVENGVRLLAQTIQTIAQRNSPTPLPGPIASRAILFNAVMTDPGKDKIATRKALKAVLGFDMLAAYNAVEHVPHVLKAGLTQSEAERLKEALAKVGANVEFRPESSDG